MPLHFVKMHGIGNDYVYLDACAEPAIERRVDQPGWTSLVARLSDRHKGIGGDGVILVCPPRRSDSHARMRMFNADGSESEMCGNGVRCVAKFAHDRLGVRANPMRVETGRGVLEIGYATRAAANGQSRLHEATVDMGVPILTPREIPMCWEGTGLGESAGTAIGLPMDALIGALRTDSEASRLRAKSSKQGEPTPFPLPLAGCTDADIHAFADALRLDSRWSAVSMGNPHLVLWSRGPVPASGAVRELDVLRLIGPRLEHHAWFPKRTNVHVCWCESRSRVRVLTWERGSGITQACGTGACAVVVAGTLEGRLDRVCEVDLLGGRLRIEWPADDRGVRMTGPAEDVCEGVWLGEA